MSSTGARAGIVVAALAAAVGLFFVLGGGGDDTATARPQAKRATQTTASSRSTETQSSRTRTAPKAASRRAPKIQRVIVRDGKPLGGVKRLEFKRGDRVLFAVNSDVASEVHVHGFDIEKTVRTKRTVVFAFTADLEGVFEVELHEGDVKIAELRVEP